MTFAIHTFGCKVNIYESEYVINLMQAHGYRKVDFEDDADIYIINTCSVTNEADKKDLAFYKQNLVREDGEYINTVKVETEDWINKIVDNKK